MTLPELAESIRNFLQQEKPNPRLVALTNDDIEQIIQMAEICQGMQDIHIKAAPDSDEPS